MSEPTPPPDRSAQRQRLQDWWPPIAAFVAVLIGVPLLVLGAAYAIAGDDDLYSLKPTQSCLADLDGVTVTDSEDDVDDVLANSATGGALRARLPDNTLIVSFGEDEQEAERRQRSYLRFAGGTIPVQDLLVRQQNAVLLWERNPNDEERELVDGCLS
jgi:hypothetical protein